MTGRYFISYQVNTTTALLVNTRLILNGSTPIPGSIIDPVLSISIFNNSMIVSLNAGNTISLQLFGLLGAVSLIGGGATGAALTIIHYPLNTPIVLEVVNFTPDSQNTVTT